MSDTKTVVPVKVIDQAFNTDVGNAKRLVELWGEDIVYCYPWNSWLIWDGSRWKRDQMGTIDKYARLTVKAIYEEGCAEVDTYRKEQLLKHAYASESKARIMAMSEMAKSMLPILPDKFDSNKWVLNVKNGTLDLRTGVLREPRREEYITKQSQINYDPSADCPTFLKFIDTTMNHNIEVIQFVQKVVGYCLTGDTSLEYLFMCYGTGQNGKSKFIADSIAYVLGEYAAKTSVATVMEMQNGGIPNDVARLRGIRFAYASEPKKGAKLDEGKIKDLTGREPVLARFLNQEFFEYVPEFKLFISTNHKPDIKGADEGIWRRLKLIPFLAQISNEERDERLDDKLHAEASGILNWALEGCLRWQNEGIEVPSIVENATNDYRDELDALSDFITLWCETGKEFFGKTHEIYNAYTIYCNMTKDYCMSAKSFSSAIQERRFRLDRKGGHRIIHGIHLTDFARSNICQFEGGELSLDRLSDLTDNIQVNIFTAPHVCVRDNNASYLSNVSNAMGAHSDCDDTVYNILSVKSVKSVNILKEKYDRFSKPDSIQDLERLKRTMELTLMNSIEDLCDGMRYVDGYCHARGWQ